MDSANKRCITITFCDRAENHVGMEILGESRPDIGEAITVRYLKKLAKKYSNAELIMLNYEDEEAAILVLRGHIDFHDDVFDELVDLKWDTKAKMKGRVVNKKARYNLCFDKRSSSPDYENGKGRVISFRRVPELQKVKDIVKELLPERDVKIVAEGNYYYDVSKCYIGFHGDRERDFVIGTRFGASFYLHFCWYLNSEAVSEVTNIKLRSGDVYIMSSNATGKDWLTRKTPTLRHSASNKKK